MKELTLSIASSDIIIHGSLCCQPWSICWLGF